MFAIALSLLFGFIAFATLAELYASLTTGARRARLILAELSRADNATAVSGRSMPHLQARLPRRAAA